MCVFQHKPTSSKTVKQGSLRTKGKIRTIIFCSRVFFVCKEKSANLSGGTARRWQRLLSSIAGQYPRRRTDPNLLIRHTFHRNISISQSSFMPVFSPHPPIRPLSVNAGRFSYDSIWSFPPLPHLCSLDTSRSFGLPICWIVYFQDGAAARRLWALIYFYDFLTGESVLYCRHFVNFSFSLIYCLFVSFFLCDCKRRRGFFTLLSGLSIIFFQGKSWKCNPWWRVIESLL